MTRVKRTAAAGLASTGGFVNPYTFVPLPTAASPRHAPTSHRTFTGRSGRITVEVETLTPLLIGGEREAATIGRAATVSPIRLGDKYVIPATTLKGMVRSMVEVMTGSCLRNVDLTRRFTRRALAQGESLKHALVVRSLSDDKIEFRPAVAYKLQIRDELRIYVEDLSARTRSDGEVVRDGDVVKVERMGDYASIYQGGVPAILKLSDVRGNDPLQNFRRNQYVVREDGRPFELQLAGTVAAGSTGLNLVQAYNAAWADAIAEEKGLEEVWCAEQLEGCTEEDRKKWGKRAARHVLRAGDVVWADSDQPESITRIDASQIGRRAGHTAEAAVPAEFRACTDPNDLCWSCRMFGMVAGERQADDRSASFAGHVRFGWAELNGVAPKELVHLQLPALSSPKPANGWYLLPHEEDGKNQRWDAKDDLLEIAGSKLYLHKKSVTQRQGEHPDQCADVDALPSGVKFTALLRYENLSDAELGSLVAALDPRQLARDDDRFKGAALKVGMGKPVGLGSIRCSLEVDEVDRKKRYQGVRDDHVTRLQKAEIDRLVDAFLTGLRDGDTVVDGHWPALAAALDFDLASGVQVTYPPGPPKTPHEHFNWFGDHRQDALAQPEQLAAGRRQGR